MLGQHSKYTIMLLQNFCGGKKQYNAQQIINIYNALTCVYILIMISYFQNFSLGSYLYLGLHGGFNIINLAKNFIFPSQIWNQKITLGSTFIIISLQSLYWLIGLIQFLDGCKNPSNARVITAIFAYTFGLTILLISDCQKHYTLKYSKGLITNGMFKYNRNPNYLGTMMIQGSFAILTSNLYSYLILFILWIGVFYGLMINKDNRLSKYKEWKDYEQSTYLFLWKISPNNIINCAIYISLIAYLIYDYIVGGTILFLKQ